MSLVRVLALTALLGLVGCEPLSLGSSDERREIADLRAVYEREFLASRGGTADLNDFTQTRADIGAARISEPSDRFDAYLDLLEGIVLLQSGQIGQARLTADQIERSAAKIRGGSFVRRDVLYAQSFESIVDGHAALAALDGIGDPRSASPGQLEAVVRDLISAGRGVQATVCQTASGEAGAATDDGFAFVAGSAASFLLSADKTLGTLCGPDPGASELCGPFEMGQPQLAAARDLRGTFPGTATATPTQLTTLDRQINGRLDRAGLAKQPQDACS